MDYAKLAHQYTITTVRVIWEVICNVSRLKNVTIFVPMVNFVLSLYYYLCFGLSPCSVDLDDETTMHYWVSKHRRRGLRNLVVVHGCGGDARWQFVLQMSSLSKSFNIYMPDLLFYGNSSTKSMDRSPEFQAKCIMEGLKKGFHVERCSVYGISYGGWVTYRMAEMYPQEVEMVVIVSSGIASATDQKLELLKQLPIPIEKLVVPRDPEALRLLVKKSVCKYDFQRVPDFGLWEFIRIMDDKNRKAKEELILHLMSQETNSQISNLSQETLLVWGEEDKVFPTNLGYQLQRMIGPNARLNILKETGHAVNLDSPNELNALIKSFILGHTCDT
ncbi:uncharacterized protein LOC141589704 [Silene latifolia]|uniref:uncharacterized protein LOC141589704 n=1 Tax=Silene latifolia TaxID=37657 RepID=UPI003D77FD5A